MVTDHVQTHGFSLTGPFETAKRQNKLNRLLSFADDGWAGYERDANGDLTIDEASFPSGIRGLADYIHSKGLKFGIYSSAG